MPTRRRSRRRPIVAAKHNRPALRRRIPFAVISDFLLARTAQRPRPSRRQWGRSLRLEPLEDRRLLDGELSNVWITADDQYVDERYDELPSVFRVWRSEPLEGSLNVYYERLDEFTTAEPEDYTGVGATGSVTIPADMPYADIPFYAVDDMLIEGNEHIQIKIVLDPNSETPTYVIPGTPNLPETGALTILDDDIDLIVSDVKGVEGTGGEKLFQFQFLLNDFPSERFPLYVNFAIEDGDHPVFDKNARYLYQGVMDYEYPEMEPPFYETETGYQLIFTENALHSLYIPVVTDARDEHDELFLVLIEEVYDLYGGSATSWSPKDPRGEGIIIDDDGATIVGAVIAQDETCACNCDADSKLTGRHLESSNGVTNASNTNPHPIITVDAQLSTTITAQELASFDVELRLLSPEGAPFDDAVSTIKHYSAVGLADEALLRFALMVDASDFPTGNYEWRMTVTSDFLEPLVTIDVFEGEQWITNRLDNEFNDGSEFGNGWWLDGLDRLYIREGQGGIGLVDSSGNVAFFPDDGMGDWEVEPHDQRFIVSFEQNMDDSYTVAYVDGNLSHFLENGFLSERVDRNGNPTSFLYSGNLLTTIAEVSGRETTFSYNGSSMLESRTDFAGRVTSFEYEGRKLITITEPAPDGQTAAPELHFTYATEGVQTGLLEDVTDQRGFTTTLAFDEFRRLESTTAPTPDGLDVFTTTFQSLQSNAAEETSSVRTGPRTGSTTDPFTRTFVFSTDYLDNLTFWQDPEENSTTTIVDELGRVTEMIESDPDGDGPRGEEHTLYTYGDEEFPNNVTMLTYVVDDAPDIIHQWSYGVFSQLSSYTDPDGRLTSYDLDSAGNVLTMTEEGNTGTTADDLVTTFSYTIGQNGIQAGMVASSTDARGATTFVEFYADYEGIHRAGELKRIVHPDTTPREDVTPITTLEPIDNGDAGYGDEGGWQNGGVGYLDDYRYILSGDSSKVATWTFSGLEPGRYRVSATWVENPQLMVTAAPFTILDDNVPRDKVLVNQRLAPNDVLDEDVMWEYLSIVEITGTSLKVQLAGSGETGYTIADAIRIELVDDLPSSEPEIIVLSDSRNIADEIGRESFGTTLTGDPITLTFTVVNVGTDTLTLSGSPSVPDGFTLTSGFGSSSLAAGASTTFVVTLDAETAGNYGGQISFTSDDLDETTFNFAVSGAVTTIAIVDDEDDDFATVGDWTFADLPYGYGGGWQYAASEPGTGSDYATWTFEDLEPGDYRVYATWISSIYYASDAPFSILDGTTVVGGEDIDEQQAPRDLFTDGLWWDQVGGVVRIAGDTLVVKLTNDANSWVIADAVRIERADVAPEAPLRAEQRFDYSRTGNQNFHSDELGRITRTIFDDLDRAVLVEQQDPDGTGLLPAPIMAFTYDAAGNVISEEDVEGTLTSFEYTPQGWVQTVTRADGLDEEAVIAYEYDEIGRMTFETVFLDGEDDRVTAWLYGNAERTTTITYADPDGPTNPLTAPVYVYRYDLLGNLLSVKEPGDTAPGDETSYRHDRMNRVIAMVEPNPAGGTAFTTSYGYNQAGDRTSITDALSRVTSFRIDVFGRMDQMTLPDADGAGGVPAPVYAYAFDENSNLVQVTDPDPDGDSPNRVSTVTKNVYDARNRLVTVIQGFGSSAEATQRLEYDNAGQLVAEVLEMDGVAADARRTTHEFDYLGRIVRTVLPGDTAPVWTFSFDAAGNLASQTDPINQGTGESTLLEYDKLHRLVLRTDVDPDGESGQDAPLTEFAYNDADELVRMLDPLNAGTENFTEFAYDALGRRISVELATPGIGEPRPLTLPHYDARSRLIAMQQVIGTADELDDPDDDLFTFYGHDILNRRTSVQDAEGGVTSFTFDAVSNMLTLTDSESNTTTWVYDPLNRVTSEENELQDSRTFQYDLVNNLIQVEDRNQRVRTFSVDALYRRTAEVWLDEELDPLRTISFAYNDAGELTNASDPSSVYAMAYDHLGRVTLVDNNNTPGVPRVRLAQEFDANGNRTRLDVKIGTDTNDLRNSYLYDNLSRMTQVTQAANGGNSVAEKRVDFKYNAVGQFTDVNRFNDLDGDPSDEIASAAYGRDDLGRLTALTYNQDSTPLFDAYAWAYDPISRVVSFDSRDGLQEYQYDLTSQLTDVAIDSTPTEDHQYDLNGNRTNTGYVTGDNNQLLEDGTYTYLYDGEGNRIRRTHSSGVVTTFDWDYRNRLERVTDWEDGTLTTATQIVVFTYDVFDRRISRQVDSTGDIDLVGEAIERFVYDGDDVILDFLDTDGDGNNATLDKRYLQGAAVDQIMAQEDVNELITDPERVLWHFADNLATVRALADNAGDIVEHLQYDAFGSVVMASAFTRYHFTARELDAATGLQYNRARWYDPAVGRWISEDPVGFIAGDANLSRYVGNGPTNAVDPNGLDFIAIADRPVQGLPGKLGFHYSLEYWSSCVAFRPLNHTDGFTPAEIVVRSSANCGKASKVGAVELLARTGWSVWASQIKNFPAPGPDSGIVNPIMREWAVKDVWVSEIVYSDTATKIMPIHDGTAKALKVIWQRIIQLASTYPWAEQPGFATTGFKTWPRSMYKTFQSNSNTFVRYLVTNTRPLTWVEMDGNHPGDYPPHQNRDDSASGREWQFFSTQTPWPTNGTSKPKPTSAP